MSQKTLINDANESIDAPLYQILFSADHKIFAKYIRWGNPHFVDNLHKLTRILASVCDGAETLDMQGFSRFDADLGHKIARSGLSGFTDYQIRKWAQRMYRYRKQFSGSYLQRLFSDE